MEAIISLVIFLVCIIPAIALAIISLVSMMIWNTLRKDESNELLKKEDWQ